MDDLEFRRRLIAEPYDNDDDVKAATQGDNKRQQFAQEMQALDDKIASALNVDVPEDLANQLLLRQRFSEHQQRSEKRKWVFAMAASVTLVVTATFALWPKPHANLADYALAHVYHEPDTMLHLDENANLQQVNAKLAGYGAHISQASGRIFYANHCDFKGKRSLHMVMEQNGQRVTVFVVPHVDSFDDTPAEFADGHYHGQFYRHGQQGVVIIGNDSEVVESTSKTLADSIEWQSI
ncbi:DUF3379 domain-containing protein [Neiella marina]|uniref:DUF3379 domain-containing protein n=1 Tax=Neiella holothuriorum TaxID=2870530 RepID=A0ABS7EDY9_9GAMM|nr:DUF3379 family protein [Neiella holothuriorum]MBW8190439.1 DUF3379 domain-containing protein [Neiella holothuriorum]